MASQLPSNLTDLLFLLFYLYLLPLEMAPLSHPGFHMHICLIPETLGPAASISLPVFMLAPHCIHWGFPVCSNLVGLTSPHFFLFLSRSSWGFIFLLFFFFLFSSLFFIPRKATVFCNFVPSHLSERPVFAVASQSQRDDSMRLSRSPITPFSPKPTFFQFSSLNIHWNHACQDWPGLPMSVLSLHLSQSLG